MPPLQVLTIGATNLAIDLDQALLRPGRFEAVYEIPTPNPTARLEILKYHSRWVLWLPYWVCIACVVSQFVIACYCILLACQVVGWVHGDC